MTAAITAGAALVAGIYTGRNSRKSDDNKTKLAMQNAEFEREKVEQIASRQRVEDLAKDAAEERRRRRELEQQYDRDLRFLRYDRQRGWDLARFHFEMVDKLVHILRNLSFVFERGELASYPEAVAKAATRLKELPIPRSLEEPIPDQYKPELRAERAP